MIGMITTIIAHFQYSRPCAKPLLCIPFNACNDPISLVLMPSLYKTLNDLFKLAEKELAVA